MKTKTPLEESFESFSLALAAVADTTAEKTKVESLHLKPRTVNALLKHKILFVCDLSSLDSTTRGLGIAGFIDLAAALKAPIRPADSGDISYKIENRLSERERNVIFNRFGFMGPRKTLEETAKIHGVTRERVRQIETTAIKKLHLTISPDNSVTAVDKGLEKLYKFAQRVTNIKNVQGISSNLDSEALTRLLVTANKGLFKLVHPKDADGEYLVLAATSIDDLVEEILSTLVYQRGYVPISEVSKNFEISSDLIYGIHELDFADDCVAYRRNQNIFYRFNSIQITEDYIRKMGKPQKISDITKNTNLSMGQVRGAVDRGDVVNVGPSLYALKEWGYLPGSIADLVCYYLKEAEQPLPASKLIRLVLKQRFYSEGSVYAAIYIDPRIQRLENGYFVLESWHCENVREKQSMNVYDMTTKEAVLNILRSQDSPLSLKQITNQVEAQYTGIASTNENNVSASTYKLVAEGKVDKISRGVSVYFKAV